MPIRPTLATVDLDAVAHNYRLARASAGRPAIGVVKANAYGHGAVPVARRLAAEGAPFLAVALVEEGVELREAGLEVPILVLGAAYGERYDLLVSHRLTPLVFRRDHLAGLAAAARAAGVRAAAHLKLDTGMGRIGLPPGELAAFVDAARAAPEVAIEGLCTHFASADLEDRELTALQVRRFDDAAAALQAAGLPLRYRHLANSAGTLEFPEAWQDLTRPGIMLYGYVPFAPPGPVPPRAAEAAAALRPALRWTTGITHLKTVPAGTAVSYGGRWVAPRTSRIATLPLGYADGYHRRLSGRPGFGCGEVLVRGRRAPIAGTVCMDMCMIDVTDVPGVELGDEVVLLGTQGEARIDADELAQKAGTISYEILCNVGQRVPRAYVGQGR
ncbi:alanine racemase [Anaeromyxobacter paludicola]|uniref:Alanine racemase n=1 Tax=Anaeromyxobacter paludicola TaxID=2918171 RepID=A0ABN6N3D0_9BACT|nr:alanine racemase [Anaeromyxobacter paludicola]BDG07566.1 alanine racemase [Anaeromyxobacter paludicola]